MDFRREIAKVSSEDVITVLVGNKMDLVKREVSIEEAQDCAATHQFHAFMETSAKTGEGVEDLFEKVAEIVLRE